MSRRAPSHNYEPRTERIEFRTTADEKAFIEERAKRARVDVATWIRVTLLREGDK